MEILRRWRAVAVAVLGALAVLGLPGVAQAHSVDAAESYAKCEYVNGKSVLTVGVKFEGFNSSYRPINGTISVDGQQVQSYADYRFDTTDHTLVHTRDLTPGQHTIKAVFTWKNQGGQNGTVEKTVFCGVPAIEIVKTGVAFAYAGDTVQYGFAVTNKGTIKLTLDPIADPKCLAAAQRVAGQTDTSFDPGDTWNFTCQSTVPANAAAGQVITNTASVCGEGMPNGQGGTPAEVCDSDDHSFPVRAIAIDVEKTAVAPVVDRGTAAVFTITVTNTGPTALVNVVTGDDLCEETRTGDNAADTALDPGETWTYTCSVATTAETVSPLVNTVTATGTNQDGKTATDTDDASVELVAPEGPPPTTVTPQGTPPGAAPTTPGAGGGDVLPEEIVSGRAALRGPSGCVRQAFTARVNGREISSVVFSVDGRVVKRFSADRSSYAIKVSPSKYGFGRHRIVARVTFSAESGTRSRSMRLTFRRCAQGAVAPRFTG